MSYGYAELDENLESAAKLMLLIPTYVAESKIPDAGLGLFCKEFVSAGTIIWTFCHGFDYVVENVPENEIIKSFVLKYGYLPISGEKGWVMCADDARFFNHSDDPTCLDVGAHTTARYDLAPGTELTSDYRSFCRDPFLGFPDDAGAKETTAAPSRIMAADPAA
jgi:hypothetical protein